MTVQRYSPPAMLLHWVQAVLVIWLLWLGLTMVDLPKGAERSAAYGLHKSLGIVVLALTLVRLLWRRRCAPPPLVGAGVELKIAKGVHHALYFFLLAAPLTGYLASSFTQYPLKLFGLELPRIASPDEFWNGFFKVGHEFLAWFGLAVVALHLLGVAKHVLKRDGTLQRMLPGGRGEKPDTAG